MASQGLSSALVLEVSWWETTVAERHSALDCGNGKQQSCGSPKSRPSRGPRFFLAQAETLTLHLTKRSLIARNVSLTQPPRSPAAHIDGAHTYIWRIPIYKDGRKGRPTRPPDHNGGALYTALARFVFTRFFGCASPKFCPALKSTACTPSSAPEPAMTVAHVPLRGIMVGPAHPLLAIASKAAPGKSRSPATAGRAEAQASQTPDGSG